MTLCRVSRIGSDNIPYVETMAYQDWAPYTYLDGFYDDPSTRGTTNKRAELVTEGDSKGLQVLLPEGCVTGACAMQAKTVMIVPVESATLRFKYARASCCITVLLLAHKVDDINGSCPNISAPLVCYRRNVVCNRRDADGDSSEEMNM